MNNWKETTLGEVAENIFSGGTPDTQKSEYWNGNLNWLSSGETGQRFIYSTDRKITELGASESSTRLAKAGSVVIATAGQGNTRGQVSYLQTDTYINQSVIAISGNCSITDNKYLFYNLSNRYYELRFISEANSIRGSLTTKIIQSIKLLLPPLPEQKAIAAVLSSFDDKIELLRRENKTLESIAQTIFKEWFVKFKVNGKKLKIDSKTNLPEGWRMGKLGEILELAYGKALKEEERSGKGYPVLGSSGIVGYHNEYLVEGFGIVVGRKGSMGTVIWIEDNFFPIDTTFYVIDKIGISDLFYHYFVLRNIDFQKIGSDSAVPGLNRTLAYSLEMAIPQKESVIEYNKTVRSIFQKMKNNNSQIQTLSKLRDTLLPKLMKGEIRVRSEKGKVKSEK
jgi:type I restriction enzyme S subunit